MLIDFDGVFRIGNKLAGDAEDFFLYLRKEKIPFFILSNSTQTTGNDIKNFLLSSGVNADVDAITTIDAAADYLELNKRLVKVYCKENMQEHFSRFVKEDKPDAVVIGDLGEEWTYEILNEIFNYIKNGADIIAMQKNKFWKPDGKNYALDAGAFISALEYASSRDAILIGKPSALYFQSALKRLGYKSDTKFIMIGDDIENDVNAAQKIGGIGILVYSGKTKYPLPHNYPFMPDFEARNLTGIIEIIKDILQKD